MLCTNVQGHNQREVDDLHLLGIPPTNNCNDLSQSQ